ncbi:sulfite oxidase, mitochondrial [Copidosoma floridanum]|uniref:sulfite oxidase, mitochondrial n=1 Tax=Copidosoma floridanum TaxID=29053 RepID=UPI0006C9D6D1|nr:sulfite oxidase, mitochondrial [Copidosoma floridanum]
MSILSAVISLPVRTSMIISSQMRQRFCRNFSKSSTVCLRFDTPLYSAEASVNKKYPSYYYKNKKKKRSKIYIVIGLFGGYCIIAALGFLYMHFRQVSTELDEKKKERKRRSKFDRIFTPEEVAAHPTWTTYKGKVYDFSYYAAGHPGGEETIKQAGGTSLEPFWEKFKFHNSPEVLKELETLKIGKLVTDHTQQPRCRTANNTPVLDPNSHRLELIFDEADENFMELNMEQLTSYPKYSIVSSIPCKKDSTKTEAQDAPTWSGTRLIDIITDLDIKMNEYEKVQFECLDKDQVGMVYRTNVSAEKANNPGFDILLAYEMNGAEIPLEHGYPIRVIIPEYPGSKNVKWLRRIVFKKRQKIVYTLGS